MVIFSTRIHPYHTPAKNSIHSMVSNPFYLLNFLVWWLLKMRKSNFSDYSFTNVIQLFPLSWRLHSSTNKIIIRMCKSSFNDSNKSTRFFFFFIDKTPSVFILYSTYSSTSTFEKSISAWLLMNPPHPRISSDRIEWKLCIKIVATIIHEWNHVIFLTTYVSLRLSPNTKLLRWLKTVFPDNVIP